MNAAALSLARLASPAAAVAWLRARAPGTLRSDSRAVRPGDAFVAWPGRADDGRGFVQSALAAGAVACLVEEKGVEAFGFDDARIAALTNLKSATGPIAHEFFGRPSERLSVLAITGTNGKTSTAWWIAQAFGLLGSGARRCGVIGTLGAGEPGDLRPTGLTTPDPISLHAALRRMADDGCAACAIEASSIGLAEHRLAGLRIEVALFTNFTPDHLDYHADMAAYWSAKRALFDWPGLKAAVVHVDDPQGERLARELAGRVDLWTCSMRAAPSARLVAEGIHHEAGGLVFTLRERSEGEDAAVPVRTALIGEYNVANLLAAAGALRASGVPLADAARAVAQAGPVPGRMQRIDAGIGSSTAPQVVVDYAHTPDALDKALAALRPFAAARGGKLWCVFGCGGNRDAVKRPSMGAIAARGADAVRVTSDNPRDEDPQSILDQIMAGVMPSDAGHVRLVLDRRAAIADAIARAEARDVVLIAGKGHEDYQETRGVRLPFSDADEAAAALAARAKAVPA